MADKKISALTAATTLDKTETFPIVQGGTTKKATIAQALAPLTILQSDAGTMLAGVPAYPVDGQVYLIESLAITGVDHIRTVGIVDANTADFVFNNNCEAYLKGRGGYVPCTYDVATNKLSYSLYADLLVTQSGSIAPTVVVARNDFGGTFSSDYNADGSYNLTPSVDLTTLGNAIYLIGGITFDETGTRFTTAKWDNGTIRLYSFRNNIASVDRIDEIFLDTPIRLIVTFSN